MEISILTYDLNSSTQIQQRHLLDHASQLSDKSLTASHKMSTEECSLLLTINDIVVICLVDISVIPLCPESSVLQPERGPYCIEHTQASCQPHTGLRKPEATDAVPQLQ